MDIYMDTGHIQYHIQLALPYTIVQLQQIKASCRIPVFLRKCWSNSANKVVHLFSKCAEVLKRSERFRLMFCFDEVAQPDPFRRLDCLKKFFQRLYKEAIAFCAYILWGFWSTSNQTHGGQWQNLWTSLKATQACCCHSPAVKFF